MKIFYIAVLIFFLAGVLKSILGVGLKGVSFPNFPDKIISGKTFGVAGEIKEGWRHDILSPGSYFSSLFSIGFTF